MAIGNKELGKIAMFGGIAGLATPLLLKYLVMPVLKFAAGIVPGISAKLANPGTINIDVSGSVTGVNTGLSQWLVDATGLSGMAASVPFNTYIMAAIGGALLLVAGAWILDATKSLTGSKFAKTAKVLFTGSALAGFILGGFAVPALGLTMVDALIVMLINAAVLAFVYVKIDEEAGIGLVPF